MRAADYAVSRILPEDLRQDTYDLSSKGVAKIMAEVATKHPDQFAEITRKIGKLGQEAAWNQGYTTTAKDTRRVIDTSKYYAQLDAEIDGLRKQNLPKREFEERREEILVKYSDIIEKETMSAAMKNRNAFAQAVASGARGNASHIKAILSTPGVYQDGKGKVIPMFVRNSFGDGVRPAESLAGTYGARTSVTAAKTATAKGGDLLKIATQSALNYNITEKDCGVDNGILQDSDAEHLRGRVLASSVGGLPAGTVVDRKAQAAIRRAGKPVKVRSALTCQSEHGLCAKCMGARADGKMPNVGESVGVTATAALFEPVVQGSLNCLREDTQVRMADGTTKTIQDIKPGDMVLGADVESSTFAVEVLSTHDQGMQPVQRYVYATAETGAQLFVDCTEAHPILQLTYYPDGEEAKYNLTPRKLPAGVVAPTIDAVLPATPDRSGSRTARRRAKKDLGLHQCYDISVDHPDELFVLANGLIVKNTKHTGGMAKGKKSFSGLNYLIQFTSIPDEFKDRAAVSDVDGTVESIEDAPQGGKYITVDGVKHLALPSFDPTVKVGDNVEAGDQLSEGLVNPHDIVRLKGLGHGRKYYADRFKQMLIDSGQNPDSRNVEVFARSVVDNFVVEDPDEDSPFNYDEVVRESKFMKSFKPAPDTKEVSTSKLTSGYLQKPVLHYTVGTRVTPSMRADIERAGIDTIPVSHQEPWYKPEMKRLRVASHDNRDWLASMNTSYLGTQLRDSLERGDETNVRENYHFAPRLAYGADIGAGGFGENIESTGKF